MKKGTKIFGLIFLSLFVVSILAGIVSAVTVFDSLTGGLTQYFKIQTLTAGTGFAQLLMFLLVTLIIFSIAESLPFVGSSTWVAFSISLIIGALSIFYLKTPEIYTILLSYSALGIALTSIIPFIVVAVISKKLFDQGYSWMSKIIWIAFGVILLIKWGSADVTQVGEFGKWAYGLTAFGILILIFFEKKIWLLFKKEELKSDAAKAESNKLTDLYAQYERLVDQQKTATGKTLDGINDELYDLTKKIRKAGGKVRIN